MTVQLNHTIVAARDAHASAEWYSELFAFEPPDHLPPFWQVTTANGVNLDFIDHDASEYGAIVHDCGARGFIPKAELSGRRLAALLE